MTSRSPVDGQRIGTPTRNRASSEDLDDDDDQKVSDHVMKQQEHSDKRCKIE